MNNLPKVLLGFVVGVVTCLVVSYGFYLAKYSYITWEMMKGSPVLAGPLMQVGVMSNVLWIFLFNKYEKPNLLKGVGFAIVFLVFLVIYLKFKFN